MGAEAERDVLVCVWPSNVEVMWIREHKRVAVCSQIRQMQPITLRDLDASVTPIGSFRPLLLVGAIRQL